jgi:glutamine synthetase
VRVASVFRGAEEASTNAELKACDATCNPYLALGGLVAAGLDGIERGLEPPEPVTGDGYRADEAHVGRSSPPTSAPLSTSSKPTRSSSSGSVPTSSRPSSR